MKNFSITLFLAVAGIAFATVRIAAVFWAIWYGWSWFSGHLPETITGPDALAGAILLHAFLTTKVTFRVPLTKRF